MTKTSKLLRALERGNEVTVSQAISRYGFESPAAVGSVIRNLREQGHSIYTNRDSNGVTKYRIGKPSRRIVAAGYAVLTAEAFG